MGIVYEAQQEEPIRRKVALKVIKAGMDTREVIRRFEGERQALAMMDHPGIAQVFDAGETEHGRPYFVMERVSGESITVYCDRRRLTIGDRLRLFIEACHAVQHAHQKGVIHRDLKPANILVGEDSEGRSRVKIIDFGIAKATRKNQDDTSLLTLEGQVLGTPQYMSPEQASDGTVDTRTDVYALGAILYELLTGSTPFFSDSQKKQPVDEIIRLIREEEPERPSTRVSRLGEDKTEKLAADRRVPVDRWMRQLRGDLDWIVLKPLQKELSRRYDTAGDLAEDIGRLLSDEPVEARPPSRSYRVRKFARRNRGLVAAAAIVAAVLVVATVVSVRWALEAQEARRLAEARLAQADAVPEFLIEAFRSVDPTEVSSELLAVDVLDQAVAEAAEEFSAQPVMLARILGALATTYQGLGYYDKAEETLDLVTEKIYGIGDLPADLRTRLLVTSSETHRLGARMDAAIEVSRRNVELAIDTHGVESLAALEARREHLRNLIDAGHLGQADALMSQLLRDSEKLGGEEMKEYRALLGTLRAEQGRFDEALALLRERLRDHGGSIVDADWNLMWKIRHLAAALLAAGRSEEAVAWGEALLTCTESIYGSSHHLTVEAAVLLIESYRRTGEAEAAWLLASVALEKATKKGLGASRTRFLREHREAIDLAPEEKERLERFCHLPLETSTGTLDGDLPTVESAGFWRVVSEHRATLGEIEAAATAAELSVELTSDRSGLQYSMRLARYALLLIQAERREEAEKVLVSMSATGFDDEFGARAIRDASVRLIRSYQEAGEAHLACELDRKVLQPALAAQKPLDPILIMQSYYRVVDHLVDTNKSEELQEFRSEIIERLHPRGKSAAVMLATIWTDYAAGFCHAKEPVEAHRILDQYEDWQESHVDGGDLYGEMRLCKMRSFAYLIEGDFDKSEATLRKAWGVMQEWKKVEEAEDMARAHERFLALDFVRLFAQTGDDHREADWRIRAAMLGMSPEFAGDLDVAIKDSNWRSAAALVAACLESNEQSEVDRLAVARVSAQIAEKLQDSGDSRAAEELLWTSLNYLSTYPRPPVDRVMEQYELLQRVRSGPKDPEGSAAFHAEMVRLFTEGPGPDHLATRILRLRHARLLAKAGQVDEAFPLIEELARNQVVREEPWTAWAVEVRSTHGQLLGELGRHAEAEEVLLAVWADCEAAVEERRRDHPGPPLEARVARNLADHFESTGNEERAEHWRGEAMRRENSARE